MGLSDGAQAVLVAVGAGALAVEGYLGTAPIETTVKASLMTFFGALAVGAFAIKEALGGKAPAAPVKVS
jgi:hypothetical protein